MKIGLRASTSRWMIVLAIDPENFVWKPCEIESGSSSPAERFDAWGDRYWLWGWLGLTLFFAKVTA